MARTHTLDRVGAVAGISMVAVFVFLVTSSKAVPPPNKGLTEISQVVANSSDAILRTSFIGALLSAAMLVFGIAVSARLRRSDSDNQGLWLVALGGIAATSVGLASDASTITFVRAVGHGLTGEGLWAAYPSGPDGVLISVPLAVFFLGVALCGFTQRALGRGLTWTSAILSAAFLAGAASVTGDETDGGILGLFLLVGYLGLMVWTLIVSVQLWRTTPDGQINQPAASADTH